MEYIKSSIEIIFHMKLEARETQVEEILKDRLKEMEANGKYDMSQSSIEYEKIIQKLEAEVRNHISVRLFVNIWVVLCQATFLAI